MLTFLVCFVLPMLSMCRTTTTTGKSITFKNCGPDNVLKSVEMNPCSSEPCTFHKGTNVTVTIDFVSSGVIPSVTAKVYGIVAGIPVPYSLPTPDGCNNCNLTCPLLAGEHRYQNIFPVLPAYPDIRLPVKWELVYGDDNKILCFEFPMAIVG